MSKNRGIFLFSTLACLGLIVGGAVVGSQVSGVEAARSAKTSTSTTSETTSTTESTVTSSTDTSESSEEAQIYSEGMTLRGLETVRVGDTGKFAIDFDLGETEFDGSYVFEDEAGLLEIDSDGNWTAIAAGQTEISYGYLPNESMASALADVEFAGQAPATLPIEVVDKEAVLFDGMTMTNEASDITVGDTGKFDISFEDESLFNDGSYYFNYDPALITVAADGTWEALAKGAAKVSYGYIPQETEATTDSSEEETTNSSDEEATQRTTEIAPQAAEEEQEEPSLELNIRAAIDQNAVYSYGMTIETPTGDVVVGQTGQFNPQVSLLQEGNNGQEVTFAGTFVWDYDETALTIDENGNWTALKAGNFQINYGYTPTEATLAGMQTYFGEENMPATGTLGYLMRVGDGNTDIQEIYSEGLTMTMPEVFDVANPVVEVGDKGTFKFDFSMPDVEFSGNYHFLYDPEMIEIDANGNWTAKKSGQIIVEYGYIPDSKMLAAMNGETSGSSSTNESSTTETTTTDSSSTSTSTSETSTSGTSSSTSSTSTDTTSSTESSTTESSTTDSTSSTTPTATRAATNNTRTSVPTGIKTLTMTSLEKLDVADGWTITRGMTLTAPELVTVGDTGTFTLAVDFTGEGDVAFDGTYVLGYDTTYLNVSDSGTWTALQAGTVNISYAYQPSEKMISDLNKFYVGNLPTLTSEQPFVTMTIAAATGKTPDDTGKLPQTGEENNDAIYIAFGIAITLMALAVWKKEKIFNMK
ncbi:LPXTG cell wall anchor domain-containing protein [Enterococcus sp. HY326]|uniref:LPXTG cell wall anchor domain-containing protein n=1 Tax=Enterococcus sp. HY326 TaxID=2971265 RepID=UPI00223F44BD|nr:LPXTG cell wall anchor domain-containing protein [Enterococcus sp. HY326]